MSRLELLDAVVVAADDRRVPVDDDADRVAVHVRGAARGVRAEVP
jgi:hypothetical protein